MFAVFAVIALLVVQEGEADRWTYVPARAGAPAAAEFSVFSATCRRRGTLELTYRFSQSDVDPETAAKEGITVFLVDSEGEDMKALKVQTRTKGQEAIAGDLALTAALVREIDEAPYLQLYSGNGPANRFLGGRTEALRRVIRECAPR